MELKFSQFIKGNRLLPHFSLTGENNPLYGINFKYIL